MLAFTLRSAVILSAVVLTPPIVRSAPLRAGAAKIEITDRSAGPVNDPLYVKALVLKNDATTVVLVTIDAVAIGEIGRIRSDFLAKVRAQLQAELGVSPTSVMIHASHCHGVVRSDTDQLTVQAVQAAWQKMVPARVGTGTGHEPRISENRRLLMKDGSEVDMRRAYSLPRDEDVAAIGPIDPQIGLLRLDREDGRPLALLYNFACHPIMNPPSLGNSADFPGFASQVIEEALGEGAIALFVQGCAGDINPVRYKGVLQPPNAEPLGNLLGLSVLRAWRKIDTADTTRLKIIQEVLALPRSADLERRISAIQSEQTRLLQSLKPTDINFKTFLPLLIQHKVSPDYPSFYSQGYLHDKARGTDDLVRLDAANRKSLEAYLENISSMERLTRLNVNLALLQKHLRDNRSVSNRMIDAEIVGLRVGEFTLVTFPGELTVEIGLRIKQRANLPFPFVAGYCNGYIYYLPTERQRANSGYAQEDCDCLVAPEWQRLFETKALQILSSLENN